MVDSFIISILQDHTASPAFKEMMVNSCITVSEVSYWMIQPANHQPFNLWYNFCVEPWFTHGQAPCWKIISAGFRVLVTSTTIIHYVMKLYIYKCESLHVTFSETYLRCMILKSILTSKKTPRTASPSGTTIALESVLRDVLK